ncbi:AAA family ATPase [Rhodobacteraceae bacterium 2CG4]|uniref:AAA family ATPase n=1 Tax=Halovulum marinum TaxID=2662447 RepID=A0A6L5Z6T3_9RHOB|nr:nucleoside/nucleotide kinase family protein [Halovulum marinum]MSU92271.1 AAA family ATPase [Halovulum marinum]
MSGLKDLAADAARLGGVGRAVLGLVGAPASGKSTLAERLAAEVAGAVVLPMDGFHLDDGILVPRGLRPRKGAPETFDVGGFVSLLRRVRAGETVYAPLFDRNLELARAAATEIGADAPLVIVEGNWLLHDAGGWGAVRPLLDACWYLEVPEAELAARLTARWRGFGLTGAEVRRKVQDNDLPNARLVAQGRGRADRIVTPDAPG